ncbi:hypothetical protein KNE206_04580 [Kitasatospora sp. NE20-6]|uniref:MarR family winged helix-turn-helix transcriptional regulator n=1 Tax=Kitasatospora sp. NE20-6 TaxID=2859066 RepID=UPI0034DBE0D4
METAPTQHGLAAADRQASADRAASEALTAAFDDASRGPALHGLGLLLRAAARLDRALDTAMRAECGLSHTMFEVLLMLARANGAAVLQRELAEGLTLTSGGTTRLVDRMEDAGLVRRVPSAADRRATLVQVTAHGAEAFRAAAVVHARIVGRLFLDPVAEAGRPGLFAALAAIVEAPQD